MAVIKIKDWAIDFNRMLMQMPGGDVFVLCEFKDGRLGYKTRPHDYPRVFGTTDPDFDDAVLQAWADFTFERDVLLKDNKTESKI